MFFNSSTTEQKSLKIRLPEPTFDDMVEFERIFRQHHKSNREYSFIRPDEHLPKFGGNLCRAWLLQQNMKKKGIPVLFTAQQFDNIMLQIVIKKSYEVMYGKASLPTNSKIMRHKQKIKSVQDSAIISLSH